MVGRQFPVGLASWFREGSSQKYPARLLQGEVKAAGLFSEPQMLLTEKQRESRAKVQKDQQQKNEICH